MSQTDDLLNKAERISTEEAIKMLDVLVEALSLSRAKETTIDRVFLIRAIKGLKACELMHEALDNIYDGAEDSRFSFTMEIHRAWDLIRSTIER